MTGEIAFAVVVTLIVTLIACAAKEVSSRITLKLVRWAPKHIHPKDPARARDLAEDLEAHVTRTIRTEPFRLAYALRFCGPAVRQLAKRRVSYALRRLRWRVLVAVDRRIKRVDAYQRARYARQIRRTGLSRRASSHITGRARTSGPHRG